ncbi:surfeit locus 1 family protein [Marmoricola sp. URHA0025 HA25]
MLALLVRPKFWPGHLAMIVSVAIALGLGLWQLDAWQQHRADAERDLANQPAVPLSGVITGDSPFPGRSEDQPVSFSGSWLGEDTVYVSHRELRGRTGYWVVTPVLVDGARSAMPVVRGWTAHPSAPAPSGTVQVTGWLQATEGGDAVDRDPGDDVIPALRIASLVEHVDQDLYSGYVVARHVSTAATAGVEPVTPPRQPGVSATTGLRNLLYAIEWWFFGGFAVFVWVRWCRDSVAAAEEDPQLEGTPA